MASRTTGNGSTTRSYRPSPAETLGQMSHFTKVADRKYKTAGQPKGKSVTRKERVYYEQKKQKIQPVGLSNNAN